METATVALHDNGIRLNIGGILIDKFNIPSDMVSNSFMPKVSENFVLSADQLVKGMVVLQLEKRVDPEPFVDLEALSAYTRRRINETSRWALVTEIRTFGSTIWFDAIYADGTMAVRSTDASTFWAVQKDNDFTGWKAAEGDAPEQESEFVANVNILDDDELEEADTFEEPDFVSNITFEPSAEEQAAHDELFAQPSADKPRPLWISQIPLSDVQKDDWIPMGGDLYRVIDITHFFDNYVFTVKSVSNHHTQGLSTLSLSPTILVNVKRRVQQ